MARNKRDDLKADWTGLIIYVVPLPNNTRQRSMEECCECRGSAATDNTECPAEHVSAHSFSRDYPQGLQLLAVTDTTRGCRSG